MGVESAPALGLVATCTVWRGGGGTSTLGNVMTILHTNKVQMSQQAYLTPLLPGRLVSDKCSSVPGPQTAVHWPLAEYASLRGDRYRACSALTLAIEHLTPRPLQSYTHAVFNEELTTGRFVCGTQKHAQPHLFTPMGRAAYTLGYQVCNHPAVCLFLRRHSAEQVQELASGTVAHGSFLASLDSVQPEPLFSFMADQPSQSVRSMHLAHFRLDWTVELNGQP